MKEKTIIVDSNPALRNIRRMSAERCNYMVNIFCLLLFFIVIVGCEREVVPQHLMGTWKSSDAQYADRYLKVSEQTVIYGIGDGEEVTHTIDKINSKQGAGGTVYTFYYGDAEGQKETLTVVYRPDSGGSLQVKNNEAVWEKAKGDGVSTHEKTPAQ